MDSDKAERAVLHSLDRRRTHLERLPDTLANPAEVRRSARFGNARIFSRWFDTVSLERYMFRARFLLSPPHNGTQYTLSLFLASH